MNNFTGYNPEEVRALFDQVNNSAKQVSEAVVEEIQNGVIAPISRALYTPEGVDCFEEFKNAVAGTADDIEAVFNSFNQNLTSAANEWADTVKGTHIDARNVDTIELNIDISPIQENLNGNYGIIEEDARAVANSLENVRTSIVNRLTNIGSALEANSAFMGHEQATAVSACFGRVIQIVSTAFDFLTTGDNSLVNIINAAVTKYGTFASSVSTAFNNSATQ